LEPFAVDDLLHYPSGKEERFEGPIPFTCRCETYLFPAACDLCGLDVDRNLRVRVGERYSTDTALSNPPGLIHPKSHLDRDAHPDCDAHRNPQPIGNSLADSDHHGDIDPPLGRLPRPF
jgi:hypothetical protein